MVRPYFALRDVTLLEAKTRVCWISDSRLVCELTVDRLIKFVVGICLLQITVVKNVKLKTIDTTSTIGPKLSADGSAAFRNLRTYVVRWCLEVTFSPCFRCRYGASELHSVAAFIGGKANILPLLLNWAHQVMISGRVGQPSHRTVYLTPTAICFWKYLMIVKKN